ncbi:hypothetical protein WAI453_006852 [Rhynchosporium graminicola]
MLGSRAVAEACPAAVSSLSTSMPFLYQTKTISIWSSNGTNLRYRLQNCNATLRRQYSDIRITRVPTGGFRHFPSNTGSTNHLEREAPAASGWHPGPQREARTGSQALQGVDISQSGITTSPGAKKNSQLFPTSWSLEPEEWGLDPVEKPHKQDLDIEEVDTGMELSDDLGIDEESSAADPVQPENPPEEIRDLTRKQGARKSTITDQERTAFQKIFSDIFSRSNRSSTVLDNTSDLDNDPFEMDTEPRDLQKAKQNLGNILSTAMQRQPRSRKDMEEALEKYPVPLRAAAATAMGYIKDELEFERSLPTRSAMLGMMELEALRKPERLRVESLMNAANSDFELLEIMEKEVFSLIPKLGLNGDSEQRADPKPVSLAKTKRKKGWKKAEIAQKRKDTEPQTEQQDNPEVRAEATIGPSGNGISPLALYGPLYPSYLLLGLRLLDCSFAKPSPLSLSILPRIKSLGHISQILGGSTQFYNELLRIYRFRHENFRGMIGLLKEMEYAAVEFDAETLTIVKDLRDLQLAVLRGVKGPTLKALWSMPDFVPNGFNDWKSKITKSIIAKENKAKEFLQFPNAERRRSL